MGNQIWWTFNAKPYYLSDVIIQAKAPLGTKYGNAIEEDLIDMIIMLLLEQFLLGNL